VNCSRTIGVDGLVPLAAIPIRDAFAPQVNCSRAAILAPPTVNARRALACERPEFLQTPRSHCRLRHEQFHLQPNAEDAVGKIARRDRFCASQAIHRALNTEAAAIQHGCQSPIAEKGGAESCDDTKRNTVRFVKPGRYGRSSCLRVFVVVLKTARLGTSDF
jgi:hypothetical protein